MSQVNVPLHGVCERMGGGGGPSPLVRVVYPSETMLNGSLHARRSTGGNCSVPPPQTFPSSCHRSRLHGDLVLKKPARL